MGDDLVKRLRDLGDRAEYMPHMHHFAADRIKELEAKLAEYKHVASAIDNQWAANEDEIAELKANLRELFRLLDITEQTDDGRYFKPNKIYSSRALDAEKLNQVLKDLKNVLEDRG